MKNDEKNEEDLQSNSPPDGGYGWVIVLSITLINICLTPLIQCFGIIFQEEFSLMGITAAKTSFLLHLQSALFCCVGLIGSPLLKKYSFRKVAFLGICIICIGIFLTSFASTYLQLICTVSIILGCGQGILLPATYIATNTYFKRNLTLAVSFSGTGISLSAIFMPQLCHYLLNQFGRKSTVLIFAGISLNAIVFCTLLRPRSKQSSPKNNDTIVLEAMIDENYEANNAEVYRETTKTNTKQSNFSSMLVNLFNLELLKHTPYVIVIIGMAVSFAAELNSILMMPFILPELAKFSKQDVASVLSVQSLLDITSRLLVPIFGHSLKISSEIMYSSSLILSTLGRTVIALFCDSKLAVFIAIGLMGLGKGTKAVYQSVVIPKYVELEKLPAANGLSMLSSGVLSILLGPIIGIFHDICGSYVYTLHAASTLSSFCIVLWIMFKLFTNKTVDV